MKSILFPDVKAVPVWERHKAVFVFVKWMQINQQLLCKILLPSFSLQIAATKTNKVPQLDSQIQTIYITTKTKTSPLNQNN